MASPLLLLLRVWLYRRRTQPLPTSGVFFQATQDIFSFCYPRFPLFSTSLWLASPPRGAPIRGGVLRLPYGDNSTFEVSVLGNICGLQGPSQVWGSPSPYDQCWGIPWEPRFFEAPAPLLTTLQLRLHQLLLCHHPHLPLHPRCLGLLHLQWFSTQD